MRISDWSSDVCSSDLSLIHGGAGGSGDGFFYQPTIVANLPGSAKVMRDEPFGPIAAVNRFDDIDQAVSAANALPYALAAFVFCRLSANSAIFAKEIEAGMVSINAIGRASGRERVWQLV